MTLIRSIFLLLMSTTFLCASEFCATDGNDPVTSWDPSDTCTPDAWANIKTPPIRNLTSGTTYSKHDCSIAVLLDLDQRLTSTEDYGSVLLFLKGMVSTCMDRGIGYKSYFYSMFNDTVPPTICCDQKVCSDQIGFMDYYKFVGKYDNLNAVQSESASANFTYALLGDMKPFAGPNTTCLYNTIVLLTNRIFNVSDALGPDIENIVTYGCISFTIIAVGNPEINEQLLWDNYHSLTPLQYVVPSYNSLTNLVDCIMPCGPRERRQCQMEYDNLSNCPIPATVLTTTTLATTTPGPTTDGYGEYWHIIYLFALSNRTSPAQFQHAINYIQQPLQDCIVGQQNHQYKIVVRFLARGNSDSGWLTSITDIHSHLESLNADEVLLDASATVDVYDPNTLLLVQQAVAMPENEDHGVDGPRISLLTDFVSQTFLDAYANDSTLYHNIDKYDFQIYSFDEEATDIYRKTEYWKPRQIHSDPTFNDSSSVLVPVCNIPKDKGGKNKSVTTILIIAGATCGGAILILFLVTALYRQKYIWMEKLNKFKNNQNDDLQPSDEVIDFWEISWEKLIVKNERLGHGAYGQVFKGKLIGASPAAERFHRNEAMAHADCDVAVKMLPRYANENARAEFMHEITLMKSLGWHEHIVNMLACITAGNKSCLVLEYCANRDLLRYLKQKKIELEISKSIDDQIDCTKEFLNFAWQVAQGMCFLGTKNIIHRDLAARNILISGLEGMKSAKIGDFGLSMSATPSENTLSASGRLPIKWLALESLQKEQFSFKSDVWSFGVVLFEMYSMGEIPFADVEPTDLISHLVEGNRPKRPLLAADKVADVMTRCWDKDPTVRPSFEDLIGIFTVLLEQSTEGYGYLALIKSNENYRVISDTSKPRMDELYADGPCGPSTSSSRPASRPTSRRPTLVDRIQLDTREKKQRQRTRALTLERDSIDDSDSESSEGTLPESEEETERPSPGWAARVRRRRSQLAALNPFRKNKEKGRKESRESSRRGSVPY